MAENCSGIWTRTSKIIQASPVALYEAFTNPEILITWLPPGDMTGKIHEFDARVGGGYCMSLLYPAEERILKGKTSEKEDRCRVRFVELTPPHKIVEVVSFVTDDPAIQGEMTLIVTFKAVSGGTEVVMLFENLPPGLRPEDNEAGSELSLAQLARRFGE
jgi:uncharacterized protein YndB with AHSA1/START domain